MAKREYTPRRVIYEFWPAPDNKSMKVTAMDEDTLVEAMVVTPLDTNENRMRQLAFEKLKYIQNRNRSDDNNDPGKGIVV